jgi:ribosomal protein S11
MTPEFRAFKKVLSGAVSGTVKDIAAVAIPNALIEAITTNDTASTVTDSTGAYKFILLEGTYDLKASADGYTTVDTAYTGVEVNAGENLTGYNFILQ